MQATDFGNLHDPACLGKLDGPDVRRILVERKMRASPVIVGEVAGQDAAQVAFAENQNVIQTLASDRADEPLGERILPGCPSPKHRPTVRLARAPPRSAAKTLSLVGGRATAIFRPAALHGHAGFARRTGSGRQRRTCYASSVVGRTGGAELRRPADVAMMQATDFGNLHDPARVGGLDGPGVRRILVEREMSASAVIVVEVAGQDAA